MTRGIDWSTVPSFSTELATMADPLDSMPAVVKAAYDLSMSTTLGFQEALLSIQDIYENKLYLENKELIDEVQRQAQKISDLMTKNSEIETKCETYENRYRFFLERTDKLATKLNSVSNILDHPFGKGNKYKNAGEKIRAIRDILDNAPE